MGAGITACGRGAAVKKVIPVVRFAIDFQRVYLTGNTEMKSWRLAWAVSQVSRPSNLIKHHRALHSSWKYWAAMVLKFVPRMWPWPIVLKLREGGAFVVQRFMTLYIYTEIFVDRCYDLPFMLPHNAVILDVGSNTGLFILRMKQLYPDSTVIGFEPLPSNYAQLRANLDRSDARNVTVFDCGVGGSARHEILHVHPRNIGGSSIFASQVPGGAEIGIDIIDIDDMLARTPAGHCDMLKLDCEGAEAEIIRAITPVTASRIRTVVFETTPGLYKVVDLVGHLESVGYRVAKNRGLSMAVYEHA